MSFKADTSEIRAAKEEPAVLEISLFDLPEPCRVACTAICSSDHAEGEDREDQEIVETFHF